MVIDMNVSALRTLEQIRKFLTGTSEVVFSVPSIELALRTFIEAVGPRLEQSPASDPSAAGKGNSVTNERALAIARGALDRLEASTRRGIVDVLRHACARERARMRESMQSEGLSEFEARTLVAAVAALSASRAVVEDALAVDRKTSDTWQWLDADPHLVNAAAAESAVSRTG